MSYLNLQAWFRKGGRTFLSTLCPVLFHSEPIRRFSPHSTALCILWESGMSKKTARIAAGC